MHDLMFILASIFAQVLMLEDDTYLAPRWMHIVRGAVSGIEYTNGNGDDGVAREGRNRSR